MSFVKNHIYVLSCIVGTDRGSLLIRVCHLSKITFMFCHVLWGQTGVSLLIIECHLSKITFMFCHVLWGQTGGSLLIRVCHLSKITFVHHTYTDICVVSAQCVASDIGDMQ